jgi:hypothetical protein
MKEAKVEPNHDVFRRLVMSQRMKESEAMDLGPALRDLLRSNVLSGHVDKTITFHARHVEEFVKSKVSCQVGTDQGQCARWSRVLPPLVCVCTDRFEPPRGSRVLDGLRDGGSVGRSRSFGISWRELCLAVRLGHVKAFYRRLHGRSEAPHVG